MAYIEGFVCAVPAANKDVYRKHAAEALPLFKEFGVVRMVETWGDEVPDGEVTDFKGAVKAKEDEVVVFSWFEYPDRETRNAASQKMMEDPRMQAMMQAEMPFDGKRMIWGGFDAITDARYGGQTGYVDGSLLAVPAANKEAFRKESEKTAAIFKDYGAVRVVEAWGDDVPDGKVTDYKGAVKAKDDEVVVYNWVEWPSKAVRDQAWSKVMADPRMAEVGKIYDGRRRVYGGFTPLIDA